MKDPTCEDGIKNWHKKKIGQHGRFCYSAKRIIIPVYLPPDQGKRSHPKGRIEHPNSEIAAVTQGFNDTNFKKDKIFSHLDNNYAARFSSFSGDSVEGIVFLSG
jgi:hypothetical protein